MFYNREEEQPRIRHSTLLTSAIWTGAGFQRSALSRPEIHSWEYANGGDRTANLSINMRSVETLTHVKFDSRVKFDDAFNYPLHLSHHHCPAIPSDESVKCELVGMQTEDIFFVSQPFRWVPTFAGLWDIAQEGGERASGSSGD